MTNFTQVRRVLIIGKQNTGKSTFCRCLINEMFITRKNHLIIEPDELGDGWSPYGYTRMQNHDIAFKMPGKIAINFPRSDREFLVKVSENVFNRNLVFDDVMFRITDKPRIDMMCEILGRARQTSNNIFITSHAISVVPAPLWSYFTDMFIMKSDDKPERSKYKIPDFDRINSAIELVNKLPVNSNDDLRKYIHIKRA